MALEANIKKQLSGILSQSKSNGLQEGEDECPSCRATIVFPTALHLTLCAESLCPQQSSTSVAIMANVLARKAAQVRSNCMHLLVYPIGLVQLDCFGPQAGGAARYSLENTAAAAAAAAAAVSVGGNQQQGVPAQLPSRSPQQPDQQEVRCACQQRWQPGQL
jgi:hypothetical protein